MRVFKHHLSRLILAALVLGAAGLGGIFLLPPARGVVLQASASSTVHDPVAAAHQRVVLVVPLKKRQMAIWPLVRRVARRHGMEPALVMAVIQAESRFLPLARSQRGAKGLMQIAPSTARQLKLTHPLNPRDNLEAGVSYLASLYQEYKGDLPLTLAAYNAGPAKVTAAGGVPPIAETREYVSEVLQNLNLFRSRYASIARF